MSTFAITRVLHGDHDLKLARQDYFTSKQRKVNTPIVYQEYVGPIQRNITHCYVIKVPVLSLHYIVATIPLHTYTPGDSIFTITESTSGTSVDAVRG